MDIKTSGFVKPMLAKKEKLVENVLLIEGITRSGKFLLGNLLSAIDDVEHPQYHACLEHIPLLAKKGFIDREAAKIFMQITIDNYGYETMIGRNLNFRRTDKSCIYNSPKAKEYLKRQSGPDGDKIIKKIRSQQPYFSYIVHETFPHIEIFFEMYPNLRVVRIERNPADLAYSWFHRGWGKRWGIDLKEFSIPFWGAGGPVPWFACEWPEDYKNSCEMDKIIKCMGTIIKMNKDSYDALSQTDRDKLYVVTYERLLTRTDREIAKISKFLNKKVLSEIAEVKKKEKLPALDPALIRKKKMDFIENHATGACFAMLKKMIEGYDKGCKSG